MTFTKVTEPWNHWLVRDFLTEEDFAKVKEYSYSLPAYTGNTYCDRVTEGVLFDMLQSKLFDLCAEIGYNTTGKGKYFAMEFMTMEPDYVYNKVHTDNPAKGLTFILGVSDEGTGTKLYSDKTTYHSTTEWAQNGGTMFNPSTNTSWHCFDAIGCSEIRRTLQLFIVNTLDY